MKHPPSVTAFILFLFVVAQLIGIGLVYLNIDAISIEDGHTVVDHGTTAIGERPDVGGVNSLIFVVAGVLVGTVLLLLIIKFKAFRIWKLWFLIAVWLAMAVAFGVLMPRTAALILALILALAKVFRPGMIVHNLTEIFIYGGIAVLLAPLFELIWVIALLVLISVYDVIAVFKSKHMVTMAKAQTESNLFPGIYISKAPAKSARAHAGSLAAPPAPNAANSAILGGGDIAFPLIFSAVTLTWLIEHGVAPQSALMQTLIITAASVIALASLFALAKKGKFYPAMPPLTAGCLIGLGIIALL